LHNGRAKIADFGFAKEIKYPNIYLAITSKTLTLDLLFTWLLKVFFKMFMGLRPKFGL